jgi:hypothetical protein
MWASGLVSDGLKEVGFRYRRDVNGQVSATTMCFGEEFRPVKLERHCYGLPQSHDESDFQFDARLNKMYLSRIWKKVLMGKRRLMDIIRKHSGSRPTLVFCSTRNAAQQAAQSLAKQYDALQKANAPLPWTPCHQPLGSLSNNMLQGLSSPFAGLSAD